MLFISAENDTHDGKRKCETMWPIFKIAHQKSRYVFDLYHRRKEISKELYEFCLEQGYADRNLIAKWKKVSLQIPHKWYIQVFLVICCTMPPINNIFIGQNYSSTGYMSNSVNMEMLLLFYTNVHDVGKRFWWVN